MGLLKKIVKKVGRSAKKHLRRLPNSFNVKGGKASLFNPITHGAFTAKKLVRGTRGSVQKKVLRALGQRQANSMPFQYTLGADPGSGYVHNARSLSYLTGGR